MKEKGKKPFLALKHQQQRIYTNRSGQNNLFNRYIEIIIKRV